MIKTIISFLNRSKTHDFLILCVRIIKIQEYKILVDYTVVMFFQTKNKPRFLAFKAGAIVLTATLPLITATAVRAGYLPNQVFPIDSRTTQWFCASRLPEQIGT